MTYHIRTYADGVRITLRHLPGRIEIEAAQGDKFGGFAELRDGEEELRLQNTGITRRVTSHMRGAARRFRREIVAETRRLAREVRS